MAGKACLATVFEGEISRAKEQDQPLSAERLAFMAEQVPNDYRFPTRLANKLHDEQDYVGALGAFKVARHLVLQDLEMKPDEPQLMRMLGAIDDDIAEVEAKLPI